MDGIKTHDGFTTADHGASLAGSKGKERTVWVIPPKNVRERRIPGKAGLRVCAYCRVSTEDEEQRTSHLAQVNYYTKLIKDHEGWVFSGVFADEGITGTSAQKRKEFQRMMNRCRQGKIDLILTKSISRFARNTLECLNYVRMLKYLSNPVGVIFEREGIHTLDVKSELLLTILSSMAQDESRSISENVRWSVQRRFQKGRAHCPTSCFLGYRKDENGGLLADEEQGETVQRIYREFLEGKGTTRIARGLEEDGVKTGAGRDKWFPNTVYRILRNEKYCGDVLMQKRVTLDFLTHKRAVNRGLSPQYYIRNHHEAIISRGMWERVQKELNRRGKLPGGGNSSQVSGPHCDRLPEGRLYCALCGKPLVRKICTSQKMGQKYRYEAWRCREAEKRQSLGNRKCLARGHREDAIQHSFMAMLQEMKRNPKAWLKEMETDSQEALRMERDRDWLLKELMGLEDFDPLKERIPFNSHVFQRLVIRGYVGKEGGVLYELTLGISRISIGIEKRVWRLPWKES